VSKMIQMKAEEPRQKGRAAPSGRGTDRVPGSRIVLPAEERSILVDPPSDVAMSRGGDPEDAATLPSKVSVRGLNFFYGDNQALFDNSIEIPENRVTAIIGPSGCGKSTHIRVYNRIYELYRTHRAEGEVFLDGVNVLSPSMDLIDLRKRVGMIFQRPTPFPMTIYENIAYGLKLHYHVSRSELSDRVEDALKRGALWEEVKEKLDEPATALSGGQQQRLCIARAIATEPELILMDEPCSAIDPVATAKIEDLIERLRDDYTVVLVTHNMQQAARVSDFTAFFYKGYIVEFGATKQIFTNPAKTETEDYITGRFG
jgi:phosphate transport system ATP-binding protein